MSYRDPSTWPLTRSAGGCSRLQTTLTDNQDERLFSLGRLYGQPAAGWPGCCTARFWLVKSGHHGRSPYIPGSAFWGFCGSPRMSRPESPRIYCHRLSLSSPYRPRNIRYRQGRSRVGESYTLSRVWSSQREKPMTRTRIFT